MDALAKALGDHGEDGVTLVPGAEHVYVLVRLLKALPRWCPNALVHVAILLITNSARNTPVAARVAGRPPQNVSLSDLEDIHTQVTALMKDEDFVERHVKASEEVIATAAAASAASAAPSDERDTDHRKTALFIIKTFGKLQQADASPRAPWQGSLVQWLNTPVRRQVFGSAIREVLLQKARFDRLLLLHGVPEAERGRVIDAIINEALDFVATTYEKRGARQASWIMELVHWLLVSRPRPQLAATALFTLRLCELRDPSRRYLLSRRIQGLLHYLESPTATRVHAGTAYVPAALVRQGDSVEADTFLTTLARVGPLPAGEPAAVDSPLTSSSLMFEGARDPGRRMRVLTAFGGDHLFRMVAGGAPETQALQLATEPGVWQPGTTLMWRSRAEGLSGDLED